MNNPELLPIAMVEPLGKGSHQVVSKLSSNSHIKHPTKRQASSKENNNERLGANSAHSGAFVEHSMKFKKGSSTSGLPVN